mgnify:FL=1
MTSTANDETDFLRKQARRAAEKAFALHGETVAVPECCPYSLAQVLNPGFFPAAAPKVR